MRVPVLAGRGGAAVLTRVLCSAGAGPRLAGGAAQSRPLLALPRALTAQQQQQQKLRLQRIQMERERIRMRQEELLRQVTRDTAGFWETDFGSTCPRFYRVQLVALSLYGKINCCFT